VNGIIHNCSHPNDGDAHFRITEEQIFTAIFTYLEHLFAKIKPKKLFCALRLLMLTVALTRAQLWLSTALHRGPR
jgi:hypothetical protein